MKLSDMEMAKRIAQEVDALGGRAYFVGGYVRDLIIGDAGKDIDIEIHGLTPDAALLTVISKIPATVFNAAVAIRAAPLLAMALKKALKASKLLEG